MTNAAIGSARTSIRCDLLLIIANSRESIMLKGKTALITRVDVASAGERLRPGMGRCAPCGGFHCKEIAAAFSLNLK